MLYRGLIASIAKAIASEELVINVSLYRTLLHHIPKLHKLKVAKVKAVGDQSIEVRDLLTSQTSIGMTSHCSSAARETFASWSRRFLLPQMLTFSSS